MTLRPSINEQLLEFLRCAYLLCIKRTTSIKMISEQGKNGDADGSEQEPNEPQAPNQAVALTGITHPGQHGVYLLQLS